MRTRSRPRPGTERRRRVCSVEVEREVVELVRAELELWPVQQEVERVHRLGAGPCEGLERSAASARGGDPPRVGEVEVTGDEEAPRDLLAFDEPLGFYASDSVSLPANPWVEDAAAEVEAPRHVRDGHAVYDQLEDRARALE